MGSTTFLDIIGSIIVGGLLILMALRLNASAAEASTAYYMNYVLQTNLVTLVVLVEDDFKRLGYCRTPGLITSANAIAIAESTKFSFLTDIYDNGGVDQITYWAGDTTELNTPSNYTPNPKDFYVYRRVNGNTDKWNLGTTIFNFKYLRNDTMTVLPYADAAANPTRVGAVDLSIQVESPSEIVQNYTTDTLTQSKVYWRQIHLTAKNLKFR